MSHEVKFLDHYIYIKHHKFDSPLERFYVTDETIEICKTRKVARIFLDVQYYDSHYEPIDFIALLFNLRNEELNDAPKIAMVISEVNNKYNWTNIDLRALGWEINYFTNKGAALDWLLADDEKICGI